MLIQNVVQVASASAKALFERIVQALLDGRARSRRTSVSASLIGCGKRLGLKAVHCILPGFVHYAHRARRVRQDVLNAADDAVSRGKAHCRAFNASITQIRHALGNALFGSGQNLLPAYLLAPNVEDVLRGAIRQTSAGSYLALEPATSKRLVENIKKTVGDLSAGVQKPVLLTSMDIRRYLRKMIEQDLYELPVLSYQELTQDINIQPLARVEL